MNVQAQPGWIELQGGLVGPPGRVLKLRQSGTAPSISPPLQAGWLRYHQGVEHAGQAYLRTVTHERLAVHPLSVCPSSPLPSVSAVFHTG